MPISVPRQASQFFSSKNSKAQQQTDTIKKGANLIIGKPRQASSEEKFLLQKFAKYREQTTNLKPLKSEKEPGVSKKGSARIITKKIATTPFDQLAQTIAQGSDNVVAEEYAVLKEKKLPPLQFTQQDFHFPWDFWGSTKVQKEENLKCLVDFHRVIDQVKVMSIFKSFVEALRDQSRQQLGEICERALLRRIDAQLKRLQNSNSNCKFDIKNLRSKNSTVDLYSIKNILGVGLQQNRRKNLSSGDYKFHDELSGETRVPLHSIIKRQPGQDELASFILQFSVQVRTDICLGILDGDTKNVLLADQVYDKRAENQIHNLLLETFIAQTDYRKLKNETLTRGANIGQQLFQNFIDEPKLILVDFDGFLNGNDIVRKPYDPVL